MTVKERLHHAVESMTDEERQAVAEARADRERGIKPVPLDDVLAEFDGR